MANGFLLNFCQFYFASFLASFRYQNAPLSVSLPVKAISTTNNASNTKLKQIPNPPTLYPLKSM